MFKPIPGWKGYLINEDGVLFSEKRQTIKTPQTTPYGYSRVSLCQNGKVKSVFIHRLVMLTFVGPSDLEVNHKNGNKRDNTLNNLEYVTRHENMKHAYANGLKKPVRIFGEQHVLSKLDTETVVNLKDLKGSMTQREAAKKFNISQAQVSRLWNGLRRAHG